MRARTRLAMNRAAALSLAVALPAPAAVIQDSFSGMAPVNAERLDALRGGFENSQGMQFSFAIERAVVVNGELVASTRLVLSDLLPLLAGSVPGAQLIASARTVLQNGSGNVIVPPPPGVPPRTPAGNTVAPSAELPSSIAAAPVVPVPSASPVVSEVPPPVASSPAAPATSASASPPAQSAPAGAAAGPLFVSMQAGGQTLVVPNAAAIVTAVQNSVNNQIIEARTAIDATLSSLSAMRTHAFTQAIRQQALDGLRRP